MRCDRFNVLRPPSPPPFTPSLHFFFFYFLLSLHQTFLFSFRARILIVLSSWTKTRIPSFAFFASAAAFTFRSCCWPPSVVPSPLSTFLQLWVRIRFSFFSHRQTLMVGLRISFAGRLILPPSDRVLIHPRTWQVIKIIKLWNDSRLCGWVFEAVFALGTLKNLQNARRSQVFNTAGNRSSISPLSFCFFVECLHFFSFHYSTFALKTKLKLDGKLKVANFCSFSNMIMFVS